MAPLLLLLAAGLIVAGGWPDRWRKKTASPETFVPERRERILPSDPGFPQAAALVRHFPGGAVDEARQWREVRDLSVEQVKAAIEELRKSGMLESSTNRWLPEMLFYRWGELEPAAAYAAATEMYADKSNFKETELISSPFTHAREAVVTAWIKRGGAVEAWDAAKDDGAVWGCTEIVPEEVSRMIVTSLSQLSDDDAFREMMRLNDDNSYVAYILCKARAAEAARTPESRAAFLAAAALHPEPYVLRCAYEQLFKEWARSDLDEARAGAVAMEMTEEIRREATSAVESVALDKEDDLEKAMDELVTGPADEGGGGENGRSDPADGQPDLLENLGSSGLRSGPSRVWLNDTGDGGVRSGESAAEERERILSIVDEVLPWLDLKENWKKSPAGFVDYRLRGETFEMMRQTPELKLEDEYRKLPPDDNNSSVPSLLSTMMQTVLIQRGAERFIRSLADHPPASLPEHPRVGWDDPVNLAMREWIKHDPATVKIWLERSDLPPAVMEKIEDYQDDVLTSLERPEAR